MLHQGEDLEIIDDDDWEPIDRLQASFSMNNYHYLDSAISILKRFQNPSSFNKIKSIKIDDFSGVSNADFMVIFMFLNDSMRKAVLLRHNLYSNDLNKGVDFYIENTEISNDVLKMLEAIKLKSKKRLLLKDNIFEYEGKTVKTKIGSHIHNILKSIYTALNGNNGEISYIDLAEALRKIDKKYKTKTDAFLIALVQKYVLTKNYELDRKLQKISSNSNPLIETIKNFGIMFKNNKD